MLLNELHLGFYKFSNDTKLAYNIQFKTYRKN